VAVFIYKKRTYHWLIPQSDSCLYWSAFVVISTCHSFCRLQSLSHRWRHEPANITQEGSWLPQKAPRAQRMKIKFHLKALLLPIRVPAEASSQLAESSLKPSPKSCNQVSPDQHGIRNNSHYDKHVMVLVANAPLNRFRPTKAIAWAIAL
jgi:hypothetical protein